MTTTYEQIHALRQQVNRLRAVMKDALNVVQADCSNQYELIRDMNAVLVETEVKS